jgi:hypothetical protein
MTKLTNIQREMLDLVSRIERLNTLEEMHRGQPSPDILALEGYQRLRQQYATQLEDLLATINIKAEIHLKAA